MFREKYSLRGPYTQINTRSSKRASTHDTSHPTTKAWCPICVQPGSSLYDSRSSLPHSTQFLRCTQSLRFQSLDQSDEWECVIIAGKWVRTCERRTGTANDALSLMLTLHVVAIPCTCSLSHHTFIASCHAGVPKSENVIRIVAVSTIITYKYSFLIKSASPAMLPVLSALAHALHIASMGGIIATVCVAAALLYALVWLQRRIWLPGKAYAVW